MSISYKPYTLVPSGVHIMLSKRLLRTGTRRRISEGVSDPSTPRFNLVNIDSYYTVIQTSM